MHICLLSLNIKKEFINLEEKFCEIVITIVSKQITHRDFSPTHYSVVDKKGTC